LVVFDELPAEAGIGVDALPPVLDELQGLAERHLLLPHEVGNHEAGASGDPGCAVHQDVSLLLPHSAHPLVVLCEMLLDLLLGEILDEIHFVGVLGVFVEGGAEVGATDADGSDIPLLEYVLGGGSIFVAQVDAYIDLIDFRIFVDAQSLVIEHLFDLLVIALLADPVFFVVLHQLLA